MLTTHGDIKSHVVYDEMDNSTMASQLSDEEEEDKLTDEEKKSHKFIHPLEVWEHMKKLWKENEDIMNLVFGHINSLGESISTGF